MRKRSMSVYQPRDDNQHTKKFEGVVSDGEGQSDFEDEEDITEAKEVGTIESWTKADYDLLVEKLRAALPKKDVKKAKSTLQHINWEDIQIRQHAPEEVRRVALSVLAKVRTFRTLGDMLNDVPEVVHKLLSVDKPKPPLTAYMLFMKDYIPQCSTTKEAFRTASKAFQELSAKKKKKYEDGAAQSKAEYHQKLEQFYEEHPELRPDLKTKTGRTANSHGKLQLKRERSRTPFNLFYESRLETVPGISLQKARQEWEELAVKDKLPFIRQSFDTRDDTKLLNKKEQELLAQFQGKPDFVGRNVFDYFRKQNRDKYEGLNGKVREQKLANEYKQLSERQQLDLKVAYLAARDEYIVQYQKYIKGLPEDKQKAELEYLQSVSSGGKKDKARKGKKSKEDEPNYPGSADEDPPVAESTTIKKPKPAKEKKPSKKKPAAEAVPEEDPNDDEDEAVEESHRRPPMPSPTKKSRMEPPPSPPKRTVAKPESSPEKKKKSKRALEQRFEASSGDDSSSSQRNGRKRNTAAAADATVGEEEQEEEEESVAPTPQEDSVRSKSKKKAKKDPESKEPLPEPERPPTVLVEFYRQRVYKGKVGKHKESFAALSAAKKAELSDQMKAAQKQYIVDFERFLKRLPRDQIRLYIQKVKKKPTGGNRDEDGDEEDEDEEEGSTETGSSGSDEEDDDE